MPLGIRTQQVAGVSAIVFLAAAVLFGWYLTSLAQILLEGSRLQARWLASTAYQRAFTLVARGGDPVETIRSDDGLRTILESTVYSPGLDYAVIVDPAGHVIAAADSTRIGTRLEPKGDLDHLTDAQSPYQQIRAIYTPGGMHLEVTQALVVGAVELGTIRVAVSTLLIRDDLSSRLKTPMYFAGGVVVVSVLVAMILAQLVMKPIHVIRGGLAKLSRGDVNVSVELPADAELRELGTSFSQVTARLAADQKELAGQRAMKSAVDRLEDAVGMFGQDGGLLFSNPALRASFRNAAEGDLDAPASGALADLWDSEHPYYVAVERALKGRPIDDPTRVQVPDAGDRLLLTHVVPGSGGAPVGVLLVSRDLAYLSKVESTLRYSRRLAALGRLTADIAHEIKNPLNATMIHLELLRMQVQEIPAAVDHVRVIADQVRRLDHVVQGFMKFTRPEDLHLQSVDMAAVFNRIRPMLDAEALKHQVDLQINIPPEVPAVDGDPNLLEQALINLSLNAFQAMPKGGRLTISARETPGRLVTIELADTGVGIPPENLSKIFNLYFTTKPQGSGIGLSMVFRTIQLHDGDIEVESTPGSGTTFRIQLRQAARMFEGLGR